MATEVEKLFSRLRDRAELRRFWRGWIAKHHVPQRHPLGFYVFRLMASEGSSLRLHYWPREIESYQVGFEIHDHTYELTSEIVHGRLRQSIFEMGPTPLPNPTHAVYGVDYTESGSSLAKTSSFASIVEMSSTVLVPASINRVKAGEFHRVSSIGADGSISLALTKHIGGQPRVLGPVDGPAKLIFNRDSVSRNDWIELESEFRDLL